MEDSSEKRWPPARKNIRDPEMGWRMEEIIYNTCYAAIINRLAFVGQFLTRLDPSFSTLIWAFVLLRIRFWETINMVRLHFPLGRQNKIDRCRPNLDSIEFQIPFISHARQPRCFQ